MLLANAISFSGAQQPGIGSGVALFAGGTGVNLTQFIYEYLIATNHVFYTGKNLGVNTGALAGAGNTDVGVYGGGMTGSVSTPTMTAVTNVLTYSTKVIAPGTSLGKARDQLAAAGNATVGVFAGGLISPGAPTTWTDLYTYATNTCVNGNNLGTSRYGLAGTANSTLGVFSGGYISSQVANTDLYAFASNAVSSGANLSTPTSALAAAGTPTSAVFGGGYVSTGNVTSTCSTYIYASNTWGSGAFLSTPRWNVSAAGNATTGVFVGGANSPSQGNTPLNVTDLYTYASATVASGVTMGAITSCGTTCTSPGGF